MLLYFKHISVYYFFLSYNFQLLTYPTWERHPDNFSDESKTTKDPTKTAQYFNTSTIINSAKI